LLSPLSDIVNSLTSTISADEAALVPVADTLNALTITLPAYDASLFVDQLEAGNLLGAIGEPIAADVALLPFAISPGAGSIVDAAEGTLLNLLNLIP
jgi:hypothetical protein